MGAVALFIYFAGLIIALVRTLLSSHTDKSRITAPKVATARTRVPLNLLVVLTVPLAACAAVVAAAVAPTQLEIVHIQGGLSKAQDWCVKNLAAVQSLPPGTLAYTLIAHEPGPECDRLYRCARCMLSTAY